MSAVPQLPPVAQVHLAKRQYLEIYGSSRVLNSYLQVGVACLAVVCLALVWLNARMYQSFHELKPLVIRINDVGRAEAVRYDAATYQPQEPEIKYFLSQFVQGHYSRIRATFRENYPRSLYFLDHRLAAATVEANRRNKTLDPFLAGQGDEIDVQIRNVTLQDLRKLPYHATVEFEKVYYAEGDHREVKREKHVASFVFAFEERVPNDMILVNPLGLTISYFRDDQAFQEGANP